MPSFCFAKSCTACLWRRNMSVKIIFHHCAVGNLWLVCYFGKYLLKVFLFLKKLRTNTCSTSTLKGRSRKQQRILIVLGAANVSTSNPDGSEEAAGWKVTVFWVWEVRWSVSLKNSKGEVWIQIIRFFFLQFSWICLWISVPGGAAPTKGVIYPWSRKKA